MEQTYRQRIAQALADYTEPLRQFSDETGNTQFWRDVFTGNYPALAIAAQLMGPKLAPQSPGMPSGFRAVGDITRNGLANYEIFKDNLRKPQYIGEAYVRDRGTHAQVGRININDQFQRRGIGSALYDQIERDLGKKLMPDEMLSDAAYGLWLKRNPSAVEGYVKPPNRSFYEASSSF